MKREFKSGEVVLEVYDASLRIVMDRLLPPYKDNGDCSYTINIAGNENFGGGFPREYVEKQVDEYLDTTTKESRISLFIHFREMETGDSCHLNL